MDTVNTQSTGTAIPKLTNAKDLNIWLRAIKMWATTEEVWKYVDYETDDPEPVILHERPADPVDNEDLDRWKIKLEGWKVDYQIHCTNLRKLSVLNTMVQSSLSNEIRIRYANDTLTSLHAIIRAIYKDLRKETPLLRRELENKWEQHLTTAVLKSQGLESWTDETRRLYTELKSLDSVRVKGAEAHIEVIQVLNLITTAHSAYNEKIPDWEDNTTVPPNFYEFLNRIYYIIITAEGKKPSMKKGVTFATFQGRSESGKGKGIGEAGEKTKCEACGMSNHKVEDCRTLKGKWTGVMKNRIDDRKWRTLSNYMGNPANTAKIESWHGPRVKIQQQITNSTSTTTTTTSTPADSLTDQTKSFTTITMAALSDQELDLHSCWILDCGSDSNVCNDLSCFTDYNVYKEPVEKLTGDSTSKALGVGKVKIDVVLPNGKKDRYEITNVEYIPGMHTNIISQSHLYTKGVYHNGRFNTMNFLSNDSPWCKLTARHGLYFIIYNTRSVTHGVPAFQKPSCLSTSMAIRSRPTVSSADAELWHSRLGHIGPEALSHMTGTIGVKIIGPTTCECQTCAMTKAHRIEWKEPQRLRTSLPFGQIAMDLVSWPKAFNDEKYLLHFTCRVTRVRSSFELRSKTSGELWQGLFEFSQRLNRQFQLQIQYIQCDNEMGFGIDTRLRPFLEAETIQTFCKDEGIEILPTSPHTPHENPAEQAGGVVSTVTRAFLIESGLPKELWPPLTRAAIYILNRRPTHALNWQSPLEMLYFWLRKNRPEIYGHLPEKPVQNLAHLKRIGCRAYPVTTKMLQGTQRIQLRTEARAHIGYLVGYKSSSQYEVWVPGLKRVINTPHVIFDERFVYKDDKNAESLIQPIKDPEVERILKLVLEQLMESPVEESGLEFLESTFQTGRPSGNNNREPRSDDAKDKDNSPPPLIQQLPTPRATQSPHPPDPRIEPLISLSSPSSSSSTSPSTTKSRKPYDTSQGIDLKNVLEGPRVRKPKVLMAVIADALSSDAPNQLTVTEPKHRGEMLQDVAHREKWLAAEVEELRKITENDTYTIVPVSEAQGYPILQLTWIYKVKMDPATNTVQRYKARLCVRGDQQIDLLLPTYAATLATTTYRLMLAVATKFNLLIYSWDAVNAFTMSELDETVFTWPPPGYPRKGMIWRLNKALYGLRRSPLLWYKLLTKALEECGLKIFKEDRCVASDGVITAFWHVDDINFMVHASRQDVYNKFIEKLCTKIELTGGNLLNSFLRVQVYRDLPAKRSWICQAGYIAKSIVDLQIDVGSGKLPSIPMSDRLEANPGKADEATTNSYLQKVGRIIYIACFTRPDVSFAAAELAKFGSNPARHHHEAADNCLRYLYNTRSLALQFDGRSNDVKVYTDASYANDSVDRKSHSGYVVTMFGGPIAWRSRKQTTVTTSSTEAELLAASAAAKEQIALDRFFDELNLDLDNSMKLVCDNMQTIRLLTAEFATLQTKLRHVDIHRHWLRQEVQRGTIEVEWVATAEMLADGLTKFLSKGKHDGWIKQLGLTDISHMIAETGK